MKYPILCLAAMLLAVSCKKSAQPDRSALTALESAFASNPSDSTYDPLITQYLEIMQEFKDDEAIVEEVLVKAASASKQMGLCKQSVIFLNNLIRKNYSRKETPDDIVDMIRCMRELGKNYAADILTICFSEAFPNHPSKVELMAALPRQESAVNFLDQLANSMFPDTAGSFNKDIAYEYVDACEAFALVLPEDEKSPEFLFSAAQTAKLLQTYDKCLSLFDWIVEKYPNHPKAESAAFMKGFLFDNDLKDTALARKYYMEFVKQYPKSQFADDAEILLKNLGKSEEEILQEILDKNKGQ
ncbi:MAG: tetratricopeptide repeat protein [Saprospiraceae bacterium]|nr:tetratricopeptide repeat protein [Saprospiraceae bacterium]